MKIFVSLLVIVLSIHAKAAIPRQIPGLSKTDLAYDVLSMPEENRNLVAKAKADELYPQLLKLSRSKESPVQLRWKALTLLAYIGNEKAIPELNAALKSPDWFMRNAALISFRMYHPQKARDAAQTLLKDKALVVRSAAVDVLSSQMDAKSRDLLWEEFSAQYNFRRKQSLWIRSQIISVLSEKPETKESELFLRALRDEDKDVHSQAIVALEKLTQQKLGMPEQRVAEKRELWIKWAKARPDRIIQ